MHLDDLLGDRKSESSATSRLGRRAVNLMELIEYAGLLVLRNPRSRVRHADGEVSVYRRRGDTDLASVGELDGVASSDAAVPARVPPPRRSGCFST
jgi:hypothetical protein